MKADVLLLAAGYGKRLQPLTLVKPKPLIEVGGQALIDRNLAVIARSGARRVIVNTHYLAEQVQQFVGDGSQWGLEVCFSHEPLLLDTGGAIRQIERLLRHEVLLTVNSDILLGRDFSLNAVLQAHVENPAAPELTVVLRRDPEAAQFGEVGVDRQGMVTSFLGAEYGEVTERLMYLGVQAISRRVLAFMPPAGSVFSITRQTWVELLQRGAKLASLRYDGYWSDVGTLDRLRQAEHDLGAGLV